MSMFEEVGASTDKMDEVYEEAKRVCEAGSKAKDGDFIQYTYDLMQGIVLMLIKGAVSLEDESTKETIKKMLETTVKNIETGIKVFNVVEDMKSAKVKH